MTKIAGYHHQFLTKDGAAIALAQLDQLHASGLYEASIDITAITIDPPDGKVFEGATLLQMWHDCYDIPPGRCTPMLPSNTLVWYIHTKGASVGTTRQNSYTKIRELLQDVMIDKWRDVVAYFEAHPDTDCYGAYLPADDRYFFPHNMWWARTSHIASLPNPVEWATVLCGRKGTDVRYGYEDWITLSKPGTVARAYGVWKA